MPNGYHQLLTDRATRHGQQLAYSLKLIGDIAAEYDSRVDRDDHLAALAMIDAFYVHLRLLAEFLTKKTKSDDFGPREFGVEWTTPSTAEAEGLKEDWKDASGYVVHFSHRRVPENVNDLQGFGLGGTTFKQRATNALVVFAEFLRQLERATPAWSGGSWIPDRVTQPDLWRARLLADRTANLRTAYTETCTKVGLDGEQLLGGPSTVSR